tara:strand:+ start:7165 stop:7698 length:534 start_codon:yes stop_codon:yes gene_type:complete
MKPFFDAAKTYKSIGFYIFPLIGITATDLGGNRNFDSIMFNQSFTEVYLSIKKFKPKNAALREKPNFKYSINLLGKDWYVYHVETGMHEDLVKIKRGRYTEISEEGKEKILQHSGLQLNKKKGEFNISSTVLQALYADSPLRLMIAEYFEVEVAELPLEMMSKIPKDSKLFIENNIE